MINITPDVLALCAVVMATTLALSFTWSALNQRKKYAEHQAQLHEEALRYEKLLSDFEAVTETLALQKSEISQLQNKLEQVQLSAHQSDRQFEGANARLNEIQLQRQSLEIQQKSLEEKLLNSQQELAASQTQIAELNTAMEEREASHEKQVAQFEEQKKVLGKEFEILANKIFEEKQKSIGQSNQSNLEAILKPFKEQLSGFQQRVNEVHDASTKGNTQLNAEIKKVLEVGLKMQDEASNLTSALKGDSQQRGAWGEAQLKRTLEMSGLIEDAHYETQSPFKDADGRQKQTDYLVKLPDDKHIIIDSKVSLIDYDKAISAETEESYRIAMAEHIKAVKRHIDDLSKKDYTNLVGMRSPSFVLMFMPIEPAYMDALKHSNDLFSYGYSKNIVLVSHTTLIPILRTVANLWMMEKSNAEAREISEKAGELFNQVCLVAERLSKLGGTLKTVSNHYNDTVKALAGQQGLYGKVDRFSTLSSKVSKSLPPMEASHIDFETERLAMIAEPVRDEADESIMLDEQVPELEIDKSDKELKPAL